MLINRRRQYTGNRYLPDLTGRTVILVDEGVRTELTMRAALQSARARGARQVVVAIAVTGASNAEQIGDQVGRLVFLEERGSMAQAAKDRKRFPAVSDAEAAALFRAKTDQPQTFYA